MKTNVIKLSALLFVFYTMLGCGKEGNPSVVAVQAAAPFMAYALVLLVNKNLKLYKNDTN